MAGRDDTTAPSPRRVVHLHVGLPKTGTSYLQNVWWNSADALAAQGVAFLPRERADHLGAVLAIRNMFQPYDDAWTRGALDRLAADAAATPHRILISHESYAPAKPEQARLLLDALGRALGEVEVHVVVTARDLARQIPSAWQQRVQARGTFTFAEFRAAVFARAPMASDFWWNQDLRDVLDRWSQVVPADRVHVVTCPPPGAPRDLLLRRFCAVLGIDAAALDAEAALSNSGLSLASTELLRRVNVELGDRLPDVRNGYARVGQTYLGERILRQLGGAPARLPLSDRGEVDAITRDWQRFVTERGFDVVGDLADLEAAVASYDGTEADVTDGDVAEAAARALAAILVKRDVEMDDRFAMEDRVADLETQVWRERSVRGAARNLARRLAGRPAAGPDPAPED
jgi:hypothetical protein